jgi:ribosomal protein S18 acetylase RimI-like enzyme
MALPLTIREAYRAELDIILARIVETGWNDLPEAARARTARPLIERQILRLVEQLRDSGWHIFLVAEGETGRNLGHLWLGEIRDAFSGEARGYIHDVYVEPDARGQGIATALMAEAERISRRRGYTELGLSVAANNQRAQQLYQHLGFAIERWMMNKPLD